LVRSHCPTLPQFTVPWFGLVVTPPICLGCSTFWFAVWITPYICGFYSSLTSLRLFTRPHVLPTVPPPWLRFTFTGSPGPVVYTFTGLPFTVALLDSPHPVYVLPTFGPHLRVAVYCPTPVCLPPHVYTRYPGLISVTRYRFTHTPHLGCCTLYTHLPLPCLPPVATGPTPHVAVTLVTFAHTRTVAHVLNLALRFVYAFGCQLPRLPGFAFDSILRLNHYRYPLRTFGLITIIYVLLLDPVAVAGCGCCRLYPVPHGMVPTPVYFRSPGLPTLDTPHTGCRPGPTTARLFYTFRWIYIFGLQVAHPVFFLPIDPTTPDPLPFCCSIYIPFVCSIVTHFPFQFAVVTFASLGPRLPWVCCSFILTSYHTPGFCHTFILLPHTRLHVPTPRVTFAHTTHPLRFPWFTLRMGSLYHT